MAEVIKKQNHFELVVDDQTVGSMHFEEDSNGDMTIVHTEVSPEYGGRGLGKKLVDAAVDFARKHNIKLAATCPYAKKILERNAGAAHNS